MYLLLKSGSVSGTNDFQGKPYMFFLLVMFNSASIMRLFSLCKSKDIFVDSSITVTFASVYILTGSQQ